MCSLYNYSRISILYTNKAYNIILFSFNVNRKRFPTTKNVANDFKIVIIKYIFLMHANIVLREKR